MSYDGHSQPTGPSSPRWRGRGVPTAFCARRRAAPAVSALIGRRERPTEPLGSGGRPRSPGRLIGPGGSSSKAPCFSVAEGGAPGPADFRGRGTEQMPGALHGGLTQVSRDTSPTTRPATCRKTHDAAGSRGPTAGALTRGPTAGRGKAGKLWSGRIRTHTLRRASVEKHYCAPRGWPPSNQGPPVSGGNAV